MEKISKTKTSTGEYKTYRYWYFYHGKESKKQWCYLNKKLLAIPWIKEAIKQTTQTTTQISIDTTQTSQTTETLNSRSIRQHSQGRQRADRLAWLGYHPYEVMVAGSSPARPTRS